METGDKRSLGGRFSAGQTIETKKIVGKMKADL
jgi:hypothetical protein